ncbi:MAG: hypothetical protein AAFU65_09170 [Pseudomonadota bacterium]
MTRLFADKRVVAVLGLIACAFMYQRIVVPMLPAPEMSTDWEVPVDDDELDTAEVDDALAQPQFQLATAQYDLRNIDIGALSFNENPARDPFIDTPAVVAPLADVDVAAVVAEEKRQAATPAVYRPNLPRLTAIAFADENRAAVLDNQIVRPGDALAQFSVTEIARHHVTLRANVNQKTFTLTLTP